MLDRNYFTKQWCICEYLASLYFGKPTTVLRENQPLLAGMKHGEMWSSVPQFYLNNIEDHYVIEISRMYWAGMVRKVAGRLIRHLKNAEANVVHQVRMDNQPRGIPWHKRGPPFWASGLIICVALLVLLQKV